MPKPPHNQCNYKLPDIANEKGYRCPHPPDDSYIEGRLCVFHRPKPSRKEKSSLSTNELKYADEVEKEFHAALSNLIEGVEEDDEGETNHSIDMRGFYFPSIYFRKGFSIKPDFSYATFVEYGDHDTPKWRRQSGITFKRGALFDDTQFVGAANFSHTVFEEKVNFNGAFFMNEANFSHTAFNNDTVFSNSHFNLDATFWNCRFLGSAEFDDAGFDGFLYCGQCKFQDANFFGIKAKGARFGDSVFNGPAHIHVASFESFLELDRTQFNDVFNFDGCTLPQKTRFEKTEFRGECWFTALELPADANLTFVTVNLSRARFEDTNLENIRFRDVTWASHKGRAALWDEFRQLDEEEERNYARIAENYQQLVLNYELKRDYESAEDFHVGEMEMRRKRRGLGVKPKPLQTVREWANLFGLYRISSNYGSSYNQAFLVLLICFALTSTLFLFAGFQPTSENRASEPRIVEYNLLPDSSHNWKGLKQISTDYLKASMFTLSIITFQRDRFYEPVGWQGQLCLYIAVLVLTAQAALVLLAIRRQFRR